MSSNPGYACRREHPLYNSCRNRHCPTCQGLAARRWLHARAADILPVPYFHIVFTLPHEIAPIASSNRTVVFNLLFRTATETLRTIAADTRHGATRTVAASRSAISRTASTALVVARDILVGKGLSHRCHG